MIKENIIITNPDYMRIIRLLNDKASRRRENGDHLKRLAGELFRATRVEPREVPADVVTMNSIIEFMDLDNKITKQLKLVYPESANIRMGHVSVMAPIGTALLGYRKGDIIEWDVPSGKKRFMIREILYQPEAAGNYML